MLRVQPYSGPIGLSGLRLQASGLVTFVVSPEVESGSFEVDLMLPDLIAQQAPGRAVVLQRDLEAACQIAQSGDHDQVNRMLVFAPAEASDLVVRNEPRLSPDALLVKAVADSPAER